MSNNYHFCEICPTCQGCADWHNGIASPCTCAVCKLKLCECKKCTHKSEPVNYKYCLECLNVPCPRICGGTKNVCQCHFERRWIKPPAFKNPPEVCACGFMFVTCMCPCPCGLENCVKSRRLRNCPIKLAEASKKTSGNKST